METQLTGSDSRIACEVIQAICRMEVACRGLFRLIFGLEFWLLLRGTTHRAAGERLGVSAASGSR